MSKVLIFIAMAVPWCGLSLYLGMRLDSRLWYARYEKAKLEAYRRGWDAGFGFITRIQDAKAEQDSSVRLLTQGNSWAINFDYEVLDEEQ